MIGRRRRARMENAHAAETAAALELEAEQQQVIVAEGLRRTAIFTEAREAGARTCATCRYAKHHGPVTVRRTGPVVSEYGIHERPTRDAPHWIVANSEAECRRSIPPTWKPVRLTDWCGEWHPQPADPEETS